MFSNVYPAKHQFHEDKLVFSNYSNLYSRYTTPMKTTQQLLEAEYAKNAVLRDNWWNLAQNGQADQKWYTAKQLLKRSDNKIRKMLKELAK